MDVGSAIEATCDAMARWLTELPEWPQHPTNPSGSVSSHFGPTILSEHDCVVHFARHLNGAGVPWEDMHLELSPGQWMFNVPATGWRAPKRIDLAIARRDGLLSAALPVGAGAYQLDAVMEFALASNYWRFGAGSAGTARKKVAEDIEKVATYLADSLTAAAYVIVVEECDHTFPAGYEARVEHETGVRLRLLRGWR